MCITNNPWKGKKATKCEDLAVIYILIASAAVFFPPSQEHQKDRISLSQRETEQGSLEPQTFQRATRWDLPVVKSLSIHILKALEISMSSELMCICDKYIWNCALTKL